MEHQNNLENICLFRIQMDKRNSQGLGNDQSKCYRCKGYDLYCNSYTPVKSQKDLFGNLADNLRKNWSSN